MNIDLWHNIDLKGESAKEDILEHHFTVFSHQDSREGPLAPIMLIERVCAMILNKTSFISASQRVFLRHMVFKHPQNCVHRSCGYGGKLSELRKEGSRKEKRTFQVLSSGVTHKCPPAGFWAPPPDPCG